MRKPTFVARYNDFIQSAANHIAIFALLLPALSALAGVTQTPNPSYMDSPKHKRLIELVA